MIIAVFLMISSYTCAVTFTMGKEGQFGFPFWDAMMDVMDDG
jgi:hypothetical protein